MEIPVYLKLSEGKQLFFYIYVPMAVVFEHVLTCYSLGPCYSAALSLSIALQVVSYESLFCNYLWFCSSIPAASFCICSILKEFFIFLFFVQKRSLLLCEIVR